MSKKSQQSVQMRLVRSRNAGYQAGKVYRGWAKPEDGMPSTFVIDKKYDREAYIAGFERGFKGD
jgi:hypothetical protein